MRKIIQVWFLDENERRLISDFHTGIMYQLEDGTMVHKMSTDVIADKLVPPLASLVGSNDSTTKP